MRIAVQGSKQRTLLDVILQIEGHWRLDVCIPPFHGQSRLGHSGHCARAWQCLRCAVGALFPRAGTPSIFANGLCIAQLLYVRHRSDGWQSLELRFVGGCLGPEVAVASCTGTNSLLTA